MSKRKLLSLLLAFSMCLSLLPIGAFAAAGEATIRVGGTSANVTGNKAFSSSDPDGAIKRAKTLEVDSAQIDLTDDATSVTVTFSDDTNTQILKELVVDLQGHTLTLGAGITVPASTKLTVKSTGSAAGTLALSTYAISNSGTLELDNVVVTAGNISEAVITNAAGATLTVTGANSEIPASDGAGTTLANSGTANIGTESAPIKSFATVDALTNAAGKTLNIYAKTVSSNAALIANSGTATIAATGTLTSAAANTNAAGATLNVSADVISSVGQAFLTNDGTANVNFTTSLRATAAFTNQNGVLTVEGKNWIDAGDTALTNRPTAGASSATANVELTGQLTVGVSSGSAAAIVNDTRGNVTISADEIDCHDSASGDGAFLNNSGAAIVTYDTLKATNAFANASGATLTVTGGTLTEGDTSTNAGTMTIKGGTFTATAAALLTNNGTLTIEDGTFNGCATMDVITNNNNAAELTITKATVKGATTGAAIANTAGTTTISNGTYTSAGGDVMTAAKGKVVVKNGEFSATAAGKSAIAATGSNALELSISNGKFSAADAGGYAIKDENTASTLKITGGVFTNTAGSALSVATGPVLTIEGGTFTSKDDAVLLQGTAATKVVIKGGTFTYNPSGTFAANQPSASKVSGGTFSTKVDADGSSGDKKLTLAEGSYIHFEDGVYVVNSTKPSSSTVIKNVKVNGTAVANLTIPAAAENADDATTPITIKYSASDIQSNLLSLTFETEYAQEVRVSAAATGSAAATAGLDSGGSDSANKATISETDHKTVTVKLADDTGTGDPTTGSNFFKADGSLNNGANELYVKVVPAAGTDENPAGYYQFKFVLTSSDTVLNKVAGYDLAAEYALNSAGTPSDNWKYIAASTPATLNNGTNSLTLAQANASTMASASTPSTAVVYVPTSVKSLSASDFASETATVTFYGDDDTFTTPVTGAYTLSATKDNVLYIKAVANDGTTTKYGKVTVIVAPTTPAISSVKNSSFTTEVTAAGAATPAAAKQNTYKIKYLASETGLALDFATNNVAAIKLIVSDTAPAPSGFDAATVTALNAAAVDANFTIQDGVFAVGGNQTYNAAGDKLSADHNANKFIPTYVDYTLYVQAISITGEKAYYAFELETGTASENAALSYLQVGKDTTALIDKSAATPVDSKTAGNGTLASPFEYSVTVPYASGASTPLYVAVASDYAKVVAMDGKSASSPLADGNFTTYGTDITAVGETNEKVEKETAFNYDYSAKEPVYFQVTAQKSTVKLYYKVNITVASAGTTALLDSVKVNGVTATLGTPYTKNGTYTPAVAQLTAENAGTVKIPVIKTNTTDNLVVEITTKDNAVIATNAASLYMGNESSIGALNVTPTVADGVYTGKTTYNFISYNAQSNTTRPSIIIKVASQTGGTTNYYRVDVRLDQSSDAKLLTVFTKEPVVTETGFDGKSSANPIPMEVTVAGKSSLTKNDLTVSENATVGFSTTNAASITATSPVGLTEGNNLVYVEVTAEDNSVQFYALTVKVVDEILTYDAELAAMTNGSATLSAESGIEEKTTVTVTPSPTSGYQVKSVEVACADPDVAAPTAAASEDGKTYTFPMPASDVTVTVTFEAISAEDVATANTDSTGKVSDVTVDDDTKAVEITNNSTDTTTLSEDVVEKIADAENVESVGVKAEDGEVTLPTEAIADSQGDVSLTIQEDRPASVTAAAPLAAAKQETVENTVDVELTGTGVKTSKLTGVISVKLDAGMPDHVYYIKDGALVELTYDASNAGKKETWAYADNQVVIYVNHLTTFVLTSASTVLSITKGAANGPSYNVTISGMNLSKQYVIQVESDTHAFVKTVFSGSTATTTVQDVGDTISVFETKGAPVYDETGFLSNTTSVSEELAITAG